MSNDNDQENDELSPLAQEFEQLCETVQAQIDEKLDQAMAALREAQKLADQHGVPFRSGISPLTNSYVPANFKKTKFAELDTSTVCEIAGVWGEYIRDMFEYDGGWLHSAVC